MIDARAIRRNSTDTVCTTVTALGLRAWCLGIALLPLIAAAGEDPMTTPPVDDVLRPVIGGLAQRVIVRGHPERGALIVVVHGGPGTDEGPLFRRYSASIEQDHAVVYWEQRGTGRSYSPGIDPASMKIDRFTADLAEVVEFSSRRYRPGRPVVLLSHSWGAVPAMRYAVSHPERVSAHIAVSPVLDAPRAESASWTWALETAQNRDLHGAVRDLLRAGPPPQSVDAMLKTRRWVERLGGTFHGSMRTRDLVSTGLRDAYLNVYDLVRFGRGNAFSLKYLWPQIRQTRWPPFKPLGVATLFVVGQYDEVTPTSVTLDVVRQLSAPCKGVVIFEHSAHNAPFEEPARFTDLVRDLPRWLERCSAIDTPSRP